MGKPSGGGGGSSTIFTTNQSNSGTVGASLYVDLGVIPSGKKIWFGTLQASGPDKALTWEVRTNNLTKSAGTDADTTLLASIASTTRGTTTLDMYKSGTLHIVSVLGSGTEHFWLKIKAKSSTAGSYLYSLNYTTE